MSPKKTFPRGFEKFYFAITFLRQILENLAADNNLGLEIIAELGELLHGSRTEFFPKTIGVWEGKLRIDALPYRLKMEEEVRRVFQSILRRDDGLWQGLRQKSRVAIAGEGVIWIVDIEGFTTKDREMDEGLAEPLRRFKESLKTLKERRRL